jgi:hypothetical protein
LKPFLACSKVAPKHFDLSTRSVPPSEHSDRRIPRSNEARAIRIGIAAVKFVNGVFTRNEYVVVVPINRPHVVVSVFFFRAEVAAELRESLRLISVGIVDF